jgi:hypothetical protein
MMTYERGGIMATNTFRPYRTLRYIERKGSNGHYYYRGVTTKDDIFECQYNRNQQNYYVALINTKAIRVPYPTFSSFGYAQVEKSVLRSASLDVTQELIKDCPDCNRGKFEDNLTCYRCKGTDKLINFK